MILTQNSYIELLKIIPKYPGNYLEIGVYEGDMLRNFAERWPNKVFYGIDPFLSDSDTIGHHGVPVGGRLEAQANRAYDNFKDIPNITLFEQTSASFASEMSDEALERMNLSVVYIDGDHSTENALNDLVLSGRALPKGGFIYLDDVGIQSVKSAIEQFAEMIKDRIVTPYRYGHFILKPV